MWIKKYVYEIQLDKRTWWSTKRGLLIDMIKTSGQILCQKGGFSELIDFLDDKIYGETFYLIHNNISSKDKSKLLSFFKGVEAYSKKDGSKLSTEDLDIITENFADIFLNKKAWIKRIYNYLVKEE